MTKEGSESDKRAFVHCSGEVIQYLIYQLQYCITTSRSHRYIYLGYFMEVDLPTLQFCVPVRLKIPTAVVADLGTHSEPLGVFFCVWVPQHLLGL